MVVRRRHLMPEDVLDGVVSAGCAAAMGGSSIWARTGVHVSGLRRCSIGGSRPPSCMRTASDEEERMRIPIFAIATGFLLAGQPMAVSAAPITFTATGTVESVFGTSVLPVPADSKAGDTFVVTWTFSAPMDSDPNPKIGDYGASVGSPAWVPGPYSITVGSTTVTGTHIGSWVFVNDGFFQGMDTVELLFAGLGWDARLRFEGTDWLTGDGLPTGLELEQATTKRLEIRGSDPFETVGTLAGPIRSIESSSASHVTPEPSTMSLLAGGLAAAVGLLRRRWTTRP